MAATTLSVLDSSGSPQSLACAQDAGNSSALISLHAPAAATTGGATPFFNDAVAGTVVQVKASTGQLLSLDLLNTVAAVTYLQIFFKPSASVTLGSTAADMVIRLASSGAKTIVFAVPVGLAAGTGISLAGTTTATGSTGAAVSVSATYA